MIKLIKQEGIFDIAESELASYPYAVKLDDSLNKVREYIDNKGNITAFSITDNDYRTAVLRDSSCACSDCMRMFFDLVRLAFSPCGSGYDLSDIVEYDPNDTYYVEGMSHETIAEFALDLAENNTHYTVNNVTYHINIQRTSNEYAFDGSVSNVTIAVPNRNSARRRSRRTTNVEVAVQSLEPLPISAPENTAETRKSILKKFFYNYDRDNPIDGYALIVTLANNDSIYNDYDYDVRKLVKYFKKDEIEEIKKVISAIKDLKLKKNFVTISIVETKTLDLEKFNEHVEQS